MKVGARGLAGCLLCNERMRAALLLVVVVAACVEPASGFDGETHVVSFDWPARGVPQLDLLFVVDDSTAMAPYRERVMTLGRVGAAQLERYSAGKPDLHVGVTSRGEVAFVTDVHRPDGSRETSFDGTLADAVAALVAVGSTSTAPNQPLAAIDVARTHAFRRAGAHFMIVTFSASDDSSLDSVAAYAERANATIATGAYPLGSPRLDAFHDRRFVDDIHAASYDRVFAPLNIIVDYGAACVEAVEPYDCAISMIENDRETVVPSCAHTPEGPCWNIVDDPFECPMQKTIDIRGYARIYRPHLFGQCVAR